MFATVGISKLTQGTHLLPALNHARSLWDRRENENFSPMLQRTVAVAPPDIQEEPRSKIRVRSPQSTYTPRKSKRMNIMNPFNDLVLDDQMFTEAPMSTTLDLFTPLQRDIPQPFSNDTAASSILNIENSSPAHILSDQVSHLTSQFEQQQLFQSKSPESGPTSYNMLDPTQKKQTILDTFSRPRSCADLLSLDSSRSILNEAALRKLQNMYKAGQTVGIDGGVAPAARPPPPRKEDAALDVARRLVQWSQQLQIIDNEFDTCHQQKRMAPAFA